jgi:outer membrane lipase/esterase
MIRMNAIVRAAWAPLLALLLASCGGGTQVEAFAPTRMLVFGDETSVLWDVDNNGNAHKYGINALKDDKFTYDCALSPLWIQTLATRFSLTFKECNPKLVAAPTNVIYAAKDAMAADVKTQITSHTDLDSFSGKDLVTILAGANDVLAQYDAITKGAAEAQAVAALEASGAALSAQVNRVAELGGKVLISLVPDMGLTPFAAAEELVTPGRQAMLSRLTSAFNQKLRIGLVNDGRMIGLLLTDELIQSIYKSAAATNSTYIDAKNAACDLAKEPLLEKCTTETLVTGGTATN